MAAVPRNSKLIPFEHVVYKETPSGGMLVDLRTSACFGLNRVGADVWVRLAAGDTVATTIAAIQMMYPGQAETIEADVGKLCEEIVRAGLVARSVDEERVQS